MTQYRFGEFEFDSLRDELKRAGKSMALQPKVAQLLALFLSQPGTPISHDDIKSKIWPETEVADASLYRLISDTRQILGEDPRRPTFIKTIAGRGYKFGYPVARVANSKPISRRGRPFWIGIAFLAVAAVVWPVSRNMVRPHVERLQVLQLDSEFTLCDSDGQRLLLSGGRQRLLVLEGKQRWLVSAVVAPIHSAVIQGQAVYYLAGAPGVEIGLYRYDLRTRATEPVTVAEASPEMDIQTADGRLHLQIPWLDDGALSGKAAPTIHKYVAMADGRLVCHASTGPEKMPRILVWDPGMAKVIDATPETDVVLRQASIAGDGSCVVFLARRPKGETLLLVQDLANGSLTRVDLQGRDVTDPVAHGRRAVVLKSDARPPRFLYVETDTGRQTLLPEVASLPDGAHFVLDDDRIAFQESPDKVDLLRLKPFPQRR